MHREDLVNAGEPITPIEFTPLQGEAVPRPRLRLNRWHAAIAGGALLAALATFFVLTARSVYVEVEPANARVNIDGGFNIPMGHRFLIRSGEYEINLRARGYHPQTATVQVSDEQAQTFSYTMRKLPGLVNVDTPGLEGARVLIDDVDMGETPLQAEQQPGRG